MRVGGRPARKRSSEPLPWFATRGISLGGHHEILIPLIAAALA